MFAAQRMEIIQDFLIKNKSADISTLTSILNVSDVTVRKDLDMLEREGFLTKIHGGAILIDHEAKDRVPSVSISHHTAKQKIAKLAVTLLDDNDSIFIGQGTTCYQLSPFIQKMKRISLVTNNLAIANEVMGSIKNTYLMGGELFDVSGVPYTAASNSSGYLEGIFVHKAFISVTGIDLMAGLTCDTINEALILREVFKIARNVIVLADSHKFDHIGMYSIAPLSDIQCIVTDQCENDQYKSQMFENNIKFLTVFDI